MRRSCFFGNAKFDISHAIIWDVMESVGEIIRMVIVCWDTGLPKRKGIGGVVKYKTAEMAEGAAKKLHGWGIDGDEIWVKMVADKTK